MNLDEEAERIAKMEDPNSFEREFNFDERQIVRFPRNMGFTGFAFENDGVVYYNSLSKLLSKKSFTQPISHCTALSAVKFSAFA